MFRSVCAGGSAGVAIPGGFEEVCRCGTKCGTWEARLTVRLGDLEGFFQPK